MYPINPNVLIAAALNLRNSYPLIHLTPEHLKYGCPAQVTRVVAGRRSIRRAARDPEAVAEKALKSLGFNHWQPVYPF
jgi:hypothetical protein